MPEVRFDGDESLGGGVLIYTVAPEDYHEDMNEEEAENSSMRIGTYPPRRENVAMAKVPDINIPLNTVVVALHMQPDHGEREDGHRRVQGVILLSWPDKKWGPYSLHTVDNDGELYRGHYDITDRERALRMYVQRSAEQLFRFHNAKTPDVNYLRDAGE